MLHLRTFGTLDLRTADGASAGSLLAQPRSTALLAYLLLARPRGYLRRDTLCALFWADADDEHARGALSQALTRVRRCAGPGIFQLRGKNELRVAPGAVECDVLAFEEAVAAGDHAAALERYAGPFLHGFHVPHMPGFEDWAETERDRLRSLAAGAAQALAHEQIAGGRLAEAGQTAARALALAPEREAVAGELVSALAAAGDRLAALALYDSWASRLAGELELEPSEHVQALAREIRAAASLADREAEVLARVLVDPPAPAPEPEAPSPRAPAREAPPAPAPAQQPRTAATGSPDVRIVEAPSRPPAAPARTRRQSRHTMATGTAAGVTLLLGGWGLVQAGFLSAGFPVDASGRAPGVLAGQDWLVVADFEGPSAEPGLALAFQTLLIRDVESAGYASVVGGLGSLSRRSMEDVLARMRLPPGSPLDAALACEVAEREGAAGVLAGRVLTLGNDYVLAASVLGVEGCQELIRASAAASFDELSQAVSAVSRELRVRLGESRSNIRNSPPLPPMTASYIEALRAVSHYVTAPEIWGDEVRGAAQLREAIRIEPDFPFAHFLLALHYQRLGRFAQAVPHILRAYELRSQLPRQGRLGMEALHQRYIASDPHGAMETVEAIIADYPSVDDASMPFLADAAFWVGDRQRALDVSLEHLGHGATGLSARLAHSTASAAAWASGRVELADSLYGAMLLEASRAGQAPDRTVVLLHHLRHRDWDAAEAHCAGQTAWAPCGQLYLARGRLSAAADVLRSELMVDGTGDHPWDRAAAAAGLAHLELMRGRPDGAWKLLQWADPSLPAAGLSRAAMHLNRFLVCASAAELGRSPELPGCDVEREDPAGWDADPSFTVVLRSGAWSRRLLAVRSLERGDPAAALEQARDAVASNFGNPGVVDHLIHAMAFDRLSRPDSALARYLDASHIERDCCFPTAAAIALPLAPIYRRIGELAEDAGDLATALEYYGAFVELWGDADAELQPQVETVAARIAALCGEEVSAPRRPD